MVVGVLVVGAAGYRMVTARTTLDTQGRQALEEWVAGEFRRPLLSDESLSLEESDVPPSVVPHAMLDLEPTAGQEAGAF